MTVMKRYFNKFTRVIFILSGLLVLFLVLYFFQKFHYQEEEKKDAIRRIREKGYLTALTDRNTLNYFISRGNPAGFQLDLLESLAGYLGVKLRVIASNDISKLYYYLNNNVADVISLNIPVSSEGKGLVHFSDALGETRLVLVQRKNPPSQVLKKLQDLAPEDTVYARKNMFMYPLFRLFVRQTGDRPFLLELKDVSQEFLIKQLAEGKIKYLICPENTLMLYKRSYENLDATVLVCPLYKYAWAVNHNSDTLLMKINLWLQDFRQSGELKRAYLDYFSNQKLVNSLKSDYVSIYGLRLSPFDNELRMLSRRLSWDWRLLASLVYEESNFRLGQISSRNATGLMQLMPETARKMGMDSIASPFRQLVAGVSYLKFLNDQFYDIVPDPLERIKFILASYNVGIGRVLVAREKAIQYGKDSARWDGNVEYYLLRRSKKDPYARNDTGKENPLGFRTTGFVDDIIDRYFHYKNNIPE